MIRRDESGYSMVEVLVAIVILVIAIVPMFAMFDLGLRTATTNSNLDKARALAEKQMELAQSVPYSEVSNITDGTDGNLMYTVEQRNLGFRSDLDPSATDIELCIVDPDVDPSCEEPSDGSMTKLEICVFREGSSCENYIFKTTGVVVEQDES